MATNVFSTIEQAENESGTVFSIITRAGKESDNVFNVIRGTKFIPLYL